MDMPRAAAATAADASSVPTAPRVPHVLALSGGGFLGLYSATVLKQLEHIAGAPLGRSFQLLAGTSIGGVLALALAFELPAVRLVRLFTDHGEEVFSARPLPHGELGRLIDMGRSVLGPKYSGHALHELLLSQFGDRRLGDALHPVVVPAVDIGNGSTKVFKSPHSPSASGDGDLRAVDVAMAACAAPAYFPSVRIGERLYADGGLFAVAPDQVALHEAEHFMGLDMATLRMLSIGTAIAHYRPREPAREDAGAVGWLRDGRLILTLISAQQQHVQAMVEDRLAERYLRLDADWPPEAGLGLDVATRDAAKTLTSLALATVHRIPAGGLLPFLDPAAAAARATVAV